MFGSLTRANEGSMSETRLRRVRLGRGLILWLRVWRRRVEAAMPTYYVVHGQQDNFLRLGQSRVTQDSYTSHIPHPTSNTHAQIPNTLNKPNTHSHPLSLSAVFCHPNRRQPTTPRHRCQPPPAGTNPVPHLSITSPHLCCHKTPRRHDPAWLGAHFPARKKCHIPVDVHTRCRHKWKGLHLPLCIVPAFPQARPLR